MDLCSVLGKKKKQNTDAIAKMLEETKHNPLPLSPRHLACLRQCRLKFGEHKGCPCPMEEFDWNPGWCRVKIQELIQKNPNYNPCF
jgi:hypothetical protein